MTLPRAPGPELMDRPDVAREELMQALGDLRVVNRWFGGTRAAVQAALPELRRARVGEVRVLDVATGSADIPAALVRRARRAGIRARVLATDLHPETVAAATRAAAAEGDVEVRVADALALPFAAGEFDITMCHTALHHFGADQARRLLRELGRCARRAVVVTDLERSRTALAAVALLAGTLWRRHPVTRHDSVVSIRAAYTAAEAAELARSAGLREVSTRRHPFFRFSLVARPGRSA